MENIINKKYKILNKLGSGSFGLIYKCQNLRTKEYVAVKVESINDNLKLLKNESNIYQYLNGCEYIPKIRWFGKDLTNYYMVIDLLDYSLQELMLKKDKLPLDYIYKIGINLVLIIKTIHEKGLVHRDIKPDNFLFGLNETYKIYLVDFGFCKSYLDTNGEHIKFKPINNMIGSKNYTSINSHNKKELSRRDDMESLCYMLLYFYSGSLPWNNITDENTIVKLKYNIVNDINYPSTLLELLKYIRTINFEDKPNYHFIIDKLRL
jgi:serine/threonine protein kinase